MKVSKFKVEADWDEACTIAETMLIEERVDEADEFSAVFTAKHRHVAEDFARALVAESIPFSFELE